MKNKVYENPYHMLRTSRMVPETGEWFTFQAEGHWDEPNDLTKLTAKECILYFLRLMHLHRNDPQLLDLPTVDFPTRCEEAAEAIPIIWTLLGEVRVTQDEEQDFDFVCELALSIPIQAIELPSGIILDQFDEPGPTSWNLVLDTKSSVTGGPLFRKKSLNDYESFFRQVVADCIQMEAVRKAAHFYLNVHKSTKSKGATPNSFQLADSEKNATAVALGEQSNNIKINMHLSRQLVGSKFPPFREDAAEQWSQQMGVAIDRPIDRYGVDLTEIQFRVLESVLKGLTQTNYKGNLEPKTKEDLLQDFPNINSVEDLPKMFKYIDSIPRLKIGKRELVRLAGMNYDNQGDVDHVMQALGYLALTPFCFYYSRLAYDAGRKPVRDKKTGDWAKEDVTAFDTLLKLKIITEEGTGVFKYLEIEPSGVFLDQHETFFMLIPAQWRQEVQAKVGSGKSTKYLYLFLLFLREQYEQKRRYNQRAKVKCKYEIKGEWQELVKTIRMPESVYKGQVTRAKKILTTCLDAAQKLDYITSSKWTGDKVLIKLNSDKFYNPTHQLTEADLTDS